MCHPVGCASRAIGEKKQKLGKKIAAPRVREAANINRLGVRRRLTPLR